jgi:hypothetical protein
MHGSVARLAMGTVSLVALACSSDEREPSTGTGGGRAPTAGDPGGGAGPGGADGGVGGGGVGGAAGASLNSLSAADWRVVVAPATTVYQLPSSAWTDNNMSGWWDGDQLHFEPGDWEHNDVTYNIGSPYYVGPNLEAALSSAPLYHVIHPTRRNPDGCWYKAACIWAEGTYNAGNGVVFALIEDEGYRACASVTTLSHWRMGIAKSVDNGVTFDDLGIVLDEPGPDVCDTVSPYIIGGAGDGNWVIPGDGYAYVVYSVYGGTWTGPGPDGGSQGLGVGRILLSDLGAVESDPTTGEPVGPSKLKKWHAAIDSDGIWKVPDAVGNPTQTRCSEANDCFNSDGVTGVSTPIPGSHPAFANLSTAPGPRDVWFFPFAAVVRRGADEVTIVIASHSQVDTWLWNADKVGAWLGDIRHPGSLRGPTAAFRSACTQPLGTYLTLFGDRADTHDTAVAITGENADGTPRPIPLFGNSDMYHPSTNSTLTFCKPGEVTGACSVPPGAASFRVGSDVGCP